MSKTMRARALAALSVAAVAMTAWSSEAGSVAKKVKAVVECDRPGMAGAAKRFAFKPEHLDLRCANGASIGSIRWSRYGARTAEGKGKLGTLAEGFRQQYRVVFELRKPRGCKAAKGAIFTRITYRFPAGRPQGQSERERASFTCVRGDIGY